MQRIYLDANDVPSCLKAGYNGNKFSVVPQTEINIPMTAGLWDGGSRDTYTAIDLDSGKQIAVSDNWSAPTSNRHDKTYTIPNGIVFVRSSIFRGKNMGLTFYVNPENLTKFIPDKSDVELSESEYAVLLAARMFISSYRFDAVTRSKHIKDKPEYELVRRSLANKGMLSSNKAITTKGKNYLEQNKRDIKLY